MKDANDTILKTVQTNIVESIEFLEKFLLNLSDDDLIQPSSACFSNINSKSGEYALEWANGIKVLSKEANILIKYDLAQYYFYSENYQKCLSILDSSSEILGSSLNDSIRLYCADYEALLFVSRSVINSLERPETTILVDFKSNFLINRVESSIENNFQVSTIDRRSEIEIVIIKKKTFYF